MLKPPSVCQKCGKEEWRQAESVVRSARMYWDAEAGVYGYDPSDMEDDEHKDDWVFCGNCGHQPLTAHQPTSLPASVIRDGVEWYANQIKALPPCPVCMTKGTHAETCFVAYLHEAVV